MSTNVPVVPTLPAVPPFPVAAPVPDPPEEYGTGAGEHKGLTQGIKEGIQKVKEGITGHKEQRAEQKAEKHAQHAHGHRQEADELARIREGQQTQGYGTGAYQPGNTGSSYQAAPPTAYGTDNNTYGSGYGREGAQGYGGTQGLSQTPNTGNAYVSGNNTYSGGYNSANTGSAYGAGYGDNQRPSNLTEGLQQGVQKVKEGITGHKEHEHAAKAEKHAHQHDQYRQEAVRESDFREGLQTQGAYQPGNTGSSYHTTETGPGYRSDVQGYNYSSNTRSEY